MPTQRLIWLKNEVQLFALFESLLSKFLLIVPGVLLVYLFPLVNYLKLLTKFKFFFVTYAKNIKSCHCCYYYIIFSVSTAKPISVELRFSVIRLNLNRWLNFYSVIYVNHKNSLITLLQLPPHKIHINFICTHILSQSCVLVFLINHRKFLFFRFLLIPSCVIAGFLYGAPCSDRNTAYLSPQKSRLPKETITCLDLTGMGSISVIPHTHLLENVTTIYADHMHLEQVPYYTISFTPLLELLDLSGNNIRRVPKDSFILNPKLQTLLLADNHVAIPKRMAFLHSDSLKILSLANNKIRRLGPLTFSELPKLTVLYLDRNLLRRINPKVFRPLKRLKYLHLGNNQLKRLPPKLTMSSRKLILIAKGNPFNNTETIR